MKRLTALGVAALVASCSGRCGAARGDEQATREDDEPIPLDPLEGRDAEALLPARCTPPVSTDKHAQLVGNAIAGPDALWVSAFTSEPPALSVLSLPTGPVTTLRAQPGDAPPAVLAADGAGFVAAYFAAPGKNQQSVELVRVAAAGAGPVVITRYSRAPDESLAIDLAVVAGTPYVVWSEAGALVVRHDSARIELPPPPRAILESPRIVAHAGKLTVFAIARAWDTADAGMPSGPQNTWEGAGEPRSTSWLVGYTLDAEPRPVALTSVRGHVDAFDVGAPEAKPEVRVVFAHDATQSEQGSGGSLVRIRWAAGAEPTRAVFRSGDVGSAPIALLGSTLAYGTAAGDAVLVQLSADLEDSGRASREPAMDDARMIATWPGRGILMAGTDLGWMACAP